MSWCMHNSHTIKEINTKKVFSHQWMHLVDNVSPLKKRMCTLESIWDCQYVDLGLDFDTACKEQVTVRNEADNRGIFFVNVLSILENHDYFLSWARICLKVFGRRSPPVHTTSLDLSGFGGCIIFRGPFSIAKQSNFSGVRRR